ncbi:hypothetical protein AGMMS49940_01370 [Spirochaetia bacterium]|nr:hypothetical protein AGMMS49940_01370 [Spirochaetia bacterium]
MKNYGGIKFAAIVTLLMVLVLPGCEHPMEGSPFFKKPAEGPSGGDKEPGTPPETIPGIPSGVQTTVLSKSEIMVSWTAVEGASTYEVYDGTQSHATAFPYTVVSGLNPDTSYPFSVKAGNDHGWSGASTPVIGKTLAAGTMETLTDPPGSVSTEVLSSVDIRVSWNAVSGANSYMVLYGTEAAGSSQYGGTASSSPLTVTGLQPGTTYYFTVKAGNGAGWTAGSSPVIGTTGSLTAPSGLSVSAQTQTSLAISWNVVSGTASYKIYRSGSIAGNSDTTAYTDTGLAAGTTYSYTVSAVSSGGTEGPQSSAVSGTTLALISDPLPGTPGGVGITVLSSTEIRVSWTTVSGADSYMVYYGTEAAGSIQWAGITSGSPFTITGLQPGTAYYFTVKAGNSAGWSGGSSPVSGTTAALAAPSGLSVTAQSASGITVSWGAVTGASSYKIYRANSSSGPFTGSIGISNTTAFTDTGLTANTSYWYKVSAVNGTEGAQSAAVSGTTGDIILAAPSGLSATAQSASAMAISWNAVSGAASYKIYRLNSSSGAWTSVGASSTTAYSDAGLTANTMYYYTVSAVTGGGTEGTQSAAVSGTTTALAAPTGLSVTVQSSSGITVSWSAVTGASSYKIYRANSSSGPFTGSIGISNTTAFTDTGLTANTTYWYKVSAVNGTEGAQSGAVSGTTLRVVTVTTLVSRGAAAYAGHADGLLLRPKGVAVDNAGNVYVADTDNFCIRKISPSGAVTTFAGVLYGYADGTGTEVRFSSTAGVAVDNAGNVYVADTSNQRIRKISPSGAVTTLAGDRPYGYADGTGTEVRFYNPEGVAVDNAGNVYVADTSNQRIRKISPSGAVTTLAGGVPYGYADGTGTEARFYYPKGVAVDNAGNVYVADSYNHRIRKISPSGAVTTLAGGVSYGYADGTGTEARFYYPEGVAVDNAGNVYVADTSNQRIRKISPSGAVTTLAGGVPYGYADGTGTEARFYYPKGVAVDNAGNVYVADSYNHRIRKISPSGAVTTLAGGVSYGYADGTGTEARFYYPEGVAVDNAGNVYVADTSNQRIRKISPSGAVTTLAGGVPYGYADGTGTEARFSYPRGVAVDNAGNVYVADTNNHSIRKITQ